MIRFVFILFLSSLMLVEIRAQENYKNIFTNSYGPGEELEYEVTFGIFNVGKGITRIHDRTYYVGGRKCFKIDAYGKTADWISWITKVDDQWGGYIDSAAVVTHVSYRKIKEGKYRKDEWVSFNHKTDSAAVKEVDYETGKYTKPLYYKTPNHVRDIIGGFMYLRVVDLSQLEKGDTLTISGFFEDSAYELGVLYDGKEVLDSEIGDIRCHRLLPIMPDNKLFDGENSITCWLSDDDNQVPVKIYAEMFIGGTGLELISYKGLKHTLQLVD